MAPAAVRAAASPIESTGPEAVPPAGGHVVEPRGVDAPWPVGEPTTGPAGDGVVGSAGMPVGARRGAGSGPAADRWPRAPWITPAAPTASPYPALPDETPLWMDDAMPDDGADAEHLERLDREQRGHVSVDETERN